jgi:polyisoprenoid-binding protein YceI
MMKRTKLIICTALLAIIAVSQSGTEAREQAFADRFAGAAAIGDSGTYTFDKAHSVIGFRVKHNGLIEIPGFFRDFAGTVHYDAKDVSKSSVEFTAKATSIDTGIAGRDSHLRSKDFFEVEKFPDITFKSTKVEKKGKQWMLTGDFTMKGVTKTITFPFNISGFLPAGEKSAARMGITAATTINRRDFGVNYGGNLPGGVPVIADNIGIFLEIEAPTKRDVPAAVKASASL